MTTAPDQNTNLQRRRLPETRRSVTHKRTVCGYELYLIVGFFDDGKPGEVFIKVGKHGSWYGGMFDGLAMTVSMALQYGVPWETIRDKWKGTRFGEADDIMHTSLLDGLAQMVDHCIKPPNPAKPAKLLFPSFIEYWADDLPTGSMELEARAFAAAVHVKERGE